MSNVEGRTFYEQIQEWSVRLDEAGKCTARDVSDLLRVAGQAAEQRDPKKAKADDAFYVEAREGELRVQFRSEVPKGSVLPL